MKRRASGILAARCARTIPGVKEADEPQDSYRTEINGVPPFTDIWAEKKLLELWEKSKNACPDPSCLKGGRVIGQKGRFLEYWYIYDVNIECALQFKWDELNMLQGV